MTAEQGGPSGPDLRQGVAETDIPDGGMLAGHVDGDGVLLAHVGDEWFAIGAACSHYSGPLPEGLLVGDTVRCPWHHACFSLRTGQALRPPALNDVPCWGRGAARRPRLGGRQDKPAPRLVRPPNAPARVVSSWAPGRPATAPPRRSAARATKGPSRSSIRTATRPMIVPTFPRTISRAMRRRSGSRSTRPSSTRSGRSSSGAAHAVASIDVAGRRVRLDDGSDLAYGALLLATGASPVRLAELEQGRPAVHYLRSLADSRRIAAAAHEGAHAVVLGASFIGLEVAASLRARKMEVHVVAPDRRPLERVMGPELGDLIRRTHEAKASSSTWAGLHAGSSTARSCSTAASGCRPICWWPASGCGPTWSWRRRRGSRSTAG